MDNQKYYKSYDYDSLNKLALSSKTKKILELIPDDVKSIMDIGCGNGLITNELAKKYSVTGIDRNKKALEFVKTKTILAKADNIPVEDNSYDMVFSSELLEHLEEAAFYRAAGEMARISRRYIFVTVPNRENLKKTMVQCPGCKFIYNRSYHVRSFNFADIEKLFSGCQMIQRLEYGKQIRMYSNVILKIKQKISPPISWIPYYWTKKNHRKTTCPKCGHKFSYEYKFSILSFACDMINILILPKKPYWMFVLLKKI